jgi:hypothetical protein
MSKELFDSLINSNKIQQSDEWDLLYENLPVVFAEDTKTLQVALDRLDEVGGYGYIATWRKNLFAFNTKLLSKRCGLIDENGNLLKAARVPKN